MENDPLYTWTGKHMLNNWLWSIMGHWVFREVKVEFDSPKTMYRISDMLHERVS